MKSFVQKKIQKEMFITVYRKATKQTPASPAKVARQELPQTGTGSEFTIFGAVATAILAELGMVAPTKKDEE